MALFSSSGGQRTAMMQSAAAQQIQEAAAAQLEQGKANALLSLYQSVPQQVSALQGGNADALAALKASKDAQLGYYNQAQPLFDQYRDTGLTAWNQYANATGVNGQGGYDQATQAFRASPGYEYQKQQATDEAQRAAGAVGELYSGNTAAAISDRAGHMADQEYGNYLSRLRDIAGVGYEATGAKAGLYGQQAGVEGNYGSAAAGLADSQGARLASIYGGLGAGAAGIYSNTAENQAAGLANLGKQQIDALGFGQAAKDKAESNKLALGLAALNAAGNVGSAAAGTPKVRSSLGLT